MTTQMTCTGCGYKTWDDGVGRFEDVAHEDLCERISWRFTRVREDGDGLIPLRARWLDRAAKDLTGHIG